MGMPAWTKTYQPTHCGLEAAGVPEIAVMGRVTVRGGKTGANGAAGARGGITDSLRTDPCSPLGELLLLRRGHCQ